MQERLHRRKSPGRAGQHARGGCRGHRRVTSRHASDDPLLQHRRGLGAYLCDCCIGRLVPKQLLHTVACCR